MLHVRCSISGDEAAAIIHELLCDHEELQGGFEAVLKIGDQVAARRTGADPQPIVAVTTAGAQHSAQERNTGDTPGNSNG